MSASPSSRRRRHVGRRYEVDATELHAGAASQLRGPVEACEFADRPPSTIADGFGDEVAVERDDGTVGRSHSGQGGAPPGAGALAAWVIDGPHGHRRAGR
jgi:hypothetical protein